jgi:hypothetical protein
MINEKKVTVEFAPGAFDQFEGTQEELDELIAEIQDMFNNKTPEEIKAMSNPLTEEDFLEMPNEVKEQLARQISDSEDSGRTLQ